jgi:CO/xanthine dehydrogenase Mo-binding subunit
VTSTRASIFATPEVRVEGHEKVTGAARYAGDHQLPDMLEAAFVRSPHRRARLVRVDVAAARAMPGVRAVLTGADVRPALFGRTLRDWPVLCWDEVRFIGDRVAAVAADNREQAEAAARAVVVQYEELPSVADAEAALAPGAPTLHPDAATYEMLRGERTLPTHPNLLGYRRHEHGDVDTAFARAARVFEHTFTTARVFQGYIEPQAAVVGIEGEIVRVISTNKSPFALREQMAACIGLPAERIVVDSAYVGGDFGGKALSVDEFVLYFLSKATGRPVRSVLSYADNMQTTTTRRASRIRLRTGVDAEGRMIAHEAEILLDGGAYAAGTPGAWLVPSEAMATLPGYKLPNARLEVLNAYTNNVPGGSMRSPGRPQAAFAGESHVDLIARELGIDPLEFRERNAAQVGDRDLEGDDWQESTTSRVLSTLRRESAWGRSKTPGQGRGVAFGSRLARRGSQRTAEITLDADGTVHALMGIADQGGGALTVMQRVIATELDIPLEKVKVRRGDTDEAPLDPGIGGSTLTAGAGGAVIDGARKLRERLAAGDTPPIRVTGESVPGGDVHCPYAYAVEVSVDRETGAYRIEDVLFVVDVGTVINPVALRGQLEGGFTFGLGQAVMEELRVEEGRVVNANLGDYKLPTVVDMPPLRLVLLTDVPGPGPFGAKSVGEIANSAVSPAIANAIADAVGVRVMSLPITAEKILAALRASGTPEPSSASRSD